jgi:hypothetical protein
MAGQSPVLTLAVTFHANWWIQRLLIPVVIDCSHHTKQRTAELFCPDGVHTSCWRLSRDFFCRNTVLLFLIRKIFWKDGTDVYFSTVLIFRNQTRCK